MLTKIKGLLSWINPGRWFWMVIIAIGAIIVGIFSWLWISGWIVLRKDDDD